MQKIRGLNLNTDSYSKRMNAVVCVTVCAISIVLTFSIVNQVFADSLKPFSEETKDGSGEKSKQISNDQDYTKWSLPKNALARFGKGRIIQMRYSPGGKQLAVATQIGIWIYDAQSGKELKLLTGHTTGLQAIAYLKDGNTIAAGYTDRVGLWNTVTGKLIKTIKTGFLNTILWDVTPKKD